jgi:hypothetical protein
MRLFVAALLLLSMTACSNGIGDAIGFTNGKANGDGGSRNYSDIPSDIASLRLLNAACSKIVECHSPGPIYCDADFLQTNTVDTEIGASTGYSNYSAIVAADFSMDITANETALNSCVSEVRDLDCEHPTVVSAYLHGQPSPYAGVADIFTPVCSGVF